MKPTYWNQWLKKREDRAMGRDGLARTTKRCAPVSLHVERLEERTLLAPLAGPLPVPLVSLSFNNVNATPVVTNAFVSDLYYDVLFRKPDRRSLNTFDAALNSGGLSGGAAFANLVSSPEFRQMVEPVLSIYQSYLGRPTTSEELASGVRRIRQGTSPAQLALAVVSTAEFQSKHGNVLSESPADFVSFLFQTTLQRAPSATELANFESQARSRQARGRLLASFPLSPEVSAENPRLADQNLVTIAYLGLWNRNPDSNFGSYVDGLASGDIRGATDLGTQFIQSENYLGIGAARNFVLGLYEGLLHRNPAQDLRGYRYYRSQLVTQKMTDAAVFAAILKQSHAANTANTAALTYETLLGHQPNPSDLANAESLLQSGRAADLATQILHSGEYTRNAFSQNIQHYIVIYQENWSFDSLYGLFPGANGLANAKAANPQVDKVSGQPLATLPQPINNNVSPAVPDNRFPANLPVAPYDLTQFVPADQKTGDIVHRFYQEQSQIDGGKMDKFVTWSDNGGLTFSYVNATNLPEGQLAQQYTLDDNLFHSAFGGSFLNHQFLISAAAPVFPNAPDSTKPQLDSQGNLLLDSNGKIVKDGNVTPDNYAVNTIYSKNLLPDFKKPTDADLLPSQNDSDPTKPNYIPTIGDRLNAQGISWKWYAGGWNLATTNPAAATKANFQWHHQPFAYFDNYAPGTPGRAAHLQDEQNFFSDLASGALPAISFIKPLGPDNEHPGYASLVQGQQHVADIVKAVQNSPDWANTSIVITYDENGGRWDQAAPPTEDRWGPGTRVPAIVISPFAQRGFVDHTQYETDSILRTIEQANNVPSLSQHDANANAMFPSYSFSPSDLLKRNP